MLPSHYRAICNNDARLDPAPPTDNDPMIDRGSDFPLQIFADSALEKAKFHFFPVRYHNSVFLL